MCLSSLAPPAHAQTVRPHILIIFDTSGSMLERGKDGSPLCGYDGTDSRIFRLKQALTAAILDVGTDEANFGLQRFAQIENPTAMPTCPIGHYQPQLCELSTHSGQVSYGPWFDEGFREAIVVDVTARPAPGPAPAAADFDPADGNARELLRWIDAQEDTDQAPPIVDPELRAGYDTPLGLSLFYARLYFDNYIKPNDPRGTCRRNIVILVTDGVESCDSASGTVGADCSGSATEFHPRRAACRLNVESGIKTYVVTDTLTGPENDTIAAAGGTDRAVRVELTDPGAVKAALTGIIAEAVPASEVCNGRDDNCNGLTDEGVANMCPFDPAGLGHCAADICNCQDDNCDGQIDEGLPVGPCGLPCGCTRPDELCDGLDNDCDSTVDEGFDVGPACDNGLRGMCLRTGTRVCRADGTGTECSAPDVPAGDEQCNGVDDDCDGETDERAGAPLPGEGAPCGISVGRCTAGTTVCVDGALQCQGAGMSGTEVCNGIDDDCNGIVDDGALPDLGAACICPGLDPATADVGECHRGQLVCRGLMGLVCQGCSFPAPELCDGKDNDCDGVVDGQQTAPCPPMFVCRGGQCALPCSPGEFKCPAGCGCHEGFCLCDKCAGVTCSEGSACDPLTGRCKDRCEGVTCEAPKTCLRGICVDCYTTGCATGQRCLAGRCQDCPGGKCEPCAGVRCPDAQHCRDGACVPLCRDSQCPDGQSCAGSSCRPDPCKRALCAADEYCDPATGACQTNPCRVKACSPGEVCVPGLGECRPDPCTSIGCGDPCLRCLVTADGLAQCGPDPACTSTRGDVQAGGGAFACSLGSPAGRPAWSRDRAHERAGAGAGAGAGALAFLAALLARVRRRGTPSGARGAGGAGVRPRGVRGSGAGGPRQRRVD